MAACDAGEHRTLGVRGAADRHHVVEGLSLEFIDMLRSVDRDVDPDLAKNGDCFRLHSSRLRASAGDLDSIEEVVAEQSFGHLTSGAVAGAENQNAPPTHVENTDIPAQQVGSQYDSGLRTRTNALGISSLTSRTIPSMLSLAVENARILYVADIRRFQVDFGEARSGELGTVLALCELARHALDSQVRGTAHLRAPHGGCHEENAGDWAILSP